MHLTKAQIDDLKARLSIVEVMGSVGVESKKQGRYFVARCLFHADGKEKTPSMVVDPEKQLFNCRGACSLNGDGKTGVHAQSGGDVFTFWMKLTGQSFPQACEDLARRFSISLSAVGSGGGNGNGNDSGPAPAPNGSHPVPATNGAAQLGPAAPAATDGNGKRPALAPGYFSLEGSRIPRTIVWSQSVGEWTRQLSVNRSAQEYLEARGLVTKEIWRGLKIGYSSGSLSDLCGTEASEAYGLLQSIDLLDGDGKETMKGRVVFPLLALNQLPVNVYGRSVRDDLHPHHRFNRGKLNGLCNQNAVRRSKELLLVESVICVCSLCEARIWNAMALYGAHGPSEDLVELIRRGGVTSVVVGLDSDETGRKSAPKLVELFHGMGLSARAIEWPEKDPNEVLVRHGPDKLREIVEKLLAPALPRDVTDVTSPADVEPSVEPSPTVTASMSPLLVDDVASAELVNDATESASTREENPSESLAGTRTALAEEASEAAPRAGLETSAAEASAPSSRTSSAPTSTAIFPSPSPDELRADSLTVRYEDRRWDVTWLESPSLAQMRAQTRLELLPEAAAEGIPPLVKFLDSVNLASGRSRDGFIRGVLQLVPPESEKLLPPKDALSRLLESDLMRLFELGELRKKILSAPKPSEDVMTDERRSRARTYLAAPNLLCRLAEDLDAMGYVGERRAKLLGYLVSISRKLPEALSMVILSSSGSGKSALAEVLEKLTPEEDLLVVSRFTASSLYWMEKDALKRKFVSIEERSGSEEADYAIRALQSKKQLTMMAPVKDQASGKLGTKFFLVEGPTAFLESTTEGEINHENATRCFEERLDESAEQTRRIHEAQRFGKTPQGLRAKARAEGIAALHRDVQRCLRVVKVSIPYADLLTFPSGWTRSRRDHPRFLNLVEVIAFLLQYQRTLRYRDTDEPCGKPLSELGEDELADVYVEASEADYASAVSLYAEILAETLAELKKPLLAFHSVFREMVGERKEAAPSLLSRELRDRTRLQVHTVKRYIRELIELEYIAQAPGVRGASVSYRLVEVEERKAARTEGLLSVEELSQLIAQRRSPS